MPRRPLEGPDQTTDHAAELCGSADDRASSSELVAGAVEVLKTELPVLTEQQVGAQGAAVHHRADEIRAWVSLVVAGLDERAQPSEEVENRGGPDLEPAAAGEVPQALRSPDQRCVGGGTPSSNCDAQLWRHG